MTVVDKQIEEHRANTAALRNAGLITDYQARLANAAIAEGHELVDQGALVDVPFIITAVTFRDGVPFGDAKLPTNYLSIELMVGDAAAIQRRKDRGKLPPTWDVFDPQERLVTNDGSTGLARQITAFLAAHGAITLPDGPEAGEANTSRYDTYRGEWLASVVPVEQGEDGTLSQPYFKLGPDPVTGEVTVAPELSCPRGLRASQYRLDGFASDSSTYYAG